MSSAIMSSPVLAVASAPNTDRGIDVLRRLGKPMVVEPGRVVFAEGEHGADAFLVDAGRIRLSKDVGGGQRLAVAEVGAGGVFGEVAVLDGRPCHVTATAVVATHLVRIPGPELRQAVRRDHRVAELVIGSLSRRLRRANTQLAAQCGKTTVARVADRLLAMAQRSGGADPARLDITQCVLAEWVGASRESTSRALGHLREDGAIATGRGWIRVLDVEALGRWT